MAEITLHPRSHVRAKHVVSGPYGWIELRTDEDRIIIFARMPADKDNASAGRQTLSELVAALAEPLDQLNFQAQADEYDREHPDSLPDESNVLPLQTSPEANPF